MKKKLLFLAIIITNYCSAQYNKLYDFSGTIDGKNPFNALVSDGIFLFGTTSYGGVNDKGVLFKIKTDGTGYSKLLDFANDTVRGYYPQGSLFSDGLFLYGMTPSGGINDDGVLYKIKFDGTGYSKLLDFSSALYGKWPLGSLVSDGTFLYGMTGKGGINDTASGGDGVIFKIKPDGTGYTKLLDFAGIANGSRPEGSLFLDGNYLYGMAGFGGINSSVNEGDGVIFKIKTDGTGYSKLLDFAGASNGNTPNGDLVFDGTYLYGMTGLGGTNNTGNIFKIKPDGTGFLKLLDFTGAPDGYFPNGSLILVGSLLYGMTFYGGTSTSCSNGCGIIFKIATDGTGYSKLLDFTNFATGRNPNGTLISDGNFLYGVTNGGGLNDMGTIFKIGLTTGLTENNQSNAISICPNPSYGIFQISSDKFNISNLKINNILGEDIYESKIDNFKSEIDLSNRPNGIYFINVKTDQGVLFKKLIINK